MKRMFFVVSAFCLSALPAFAQESLDVTFDTTDLVKAAGGLLVALGALWGIRKIVGLVNRS